VEYDIPVNSSVEKREPALNFRRGIGFSLFFGLVGLLAPIVAVVSATACRWIACGSDDFDRAYDVYWLTSSVLNRPFSIGRMRSRKRRSFILPHPSPLIPRP